MNSMTELRAFFGTGNNNGASPGRGPQILRLGVALALTLATVASAQTYTVLKSFTPSDGWCPFAGLVLAGSTLYGTTYGGGSSYCGVVFKLNSEGSGYAVLKSFTGSDGALPHAGLVLAGSTLYGTTQYGGSSYSGGFSGDGVVFKVNADGSGYAALKNFSGNDGARPGASLLLAGSTLYGTTYNGGSSDCGVVFKVDTDGAGFAALKSFTGSDGKNPAAGLVWRAARSMGRRITAAVRIVAWSSR
jgi:uncharacterized repeat protein (TIGR03803 family)